MGQIHEVLSTQTGSIVLAVSCVTECLSVRCRGSPSRFHSAMQEGRNRVFSDTCESTGKGRRVAMSGKRSDFQAQQIVFPVVGSGIAGTDTEGIHTEIRSR